MLRLGVVLALLVLLALCRAQALYSATGLGGYTMAPVVTNWAFAYQLLRPEVRSTPLISFFCTLSLFDQPDSKSPLQLSISWAGTTSAAAIAAVRAGTLDFGGAVTTPSLTDITTVLLYYYYYNFCEPL